ncbi:TetR/AcrR family transcriptional regulator [Mycobacterium bohemicum]|nr:TetR/AcrR family transcriptional regulator [Mycobacterium bohemicum]MCV6971279.1 TetR/AcrR family transcriptional regulator [Mycobacterium bohemicum]
MDDRPTARPYRGVDAAQRLATRRNRLLAAGLELLGAEQPDLSHVTVRRVCHESGLAVRYFYESFPDKDEFVAAVYDWAVAGLAATTQAAIAAAPAREQTRAAVTNLVRRLAEDPRVGRLLFSIQLANPVISRKRAESTAMFAMLSGQHAGDTLRVPDNDRIRATSHFAVGGVGQTISAWLAGDVRLEPDQLVDQLTSLLNELADPGLYRVTETVTGTRADPTAASRDRAATDASSSGG